MDIFQVTYLAEGTYQEDESPSEFYTFTLPGTGQHCIDP